MHGEAEVLRIYIGEGARFEGLPPYEAIVDEARRRGLAGAAVTRGVLDAENRLCGMIDRDRVLQVIGGAKRLRAAQGEAPCTAVCPGALRKHLRQEPEYGIQTWTGPCRGRQLCDHFGLCRGGGPCAF
ncbi:MAG: hypothetical protein C0405_11965 [Desulfovibrio sp.]|nr:hypothetical protein [Desulfovibrio sp.]